MANEKNTNTITRTFNVTKGSLSKPHQVTVEFNYDGVEQETILGWATDQRVIALQSVLRKTSDGFVEGLPNPFKIRAVDAGKTIRTPEQRIAELVDAGIPRAIAETIVNNPDKLAEMEKLMSAK